MAYPPLTPTGTVNLAVGGTSSNVQLSAAGIQRIVNSGPTSVIIKFGADNTVTAVVGTGVIVLAGQTEYLNSGTNTWLAAVTLNGSNVAPNSQLNITSGT